MKENNNLSKIFEDNNNKLNDIKFFFDDENFIKENDILDYENNKQNFENFSEKSDDNIEFKFISSDLYMFKEKVSNQIKTKYNEQKIYLFKTTTIKRHTKMARDNILVKIKSNLLKNIVKLINLLFSSGKIKIKFNQIRYEVSKKIKKEFNKNLLKTKIKKLLQFNSKKNTKIIELLEKQKILENEIKQKIIKIIFELLNLNVEDFIEILFEEDWLYKFIEKMKLKENFLKNNKINLRINLNVLECMKEKELQKYGKLDKEYFDKVEKIMEKIKENINKNKFYLRIFLKIYKCKKKKDSQKYIIINNEYLNKVKNKIKEKNKAIKYRIIRKKNYIMR